ncbi:DUF2470 domain-containing protein [Streptomyces sp. DSM 44917]|uniref:DUF2470 domain-containing protein n=1 Tax=Streptomyces boetiae TaxID=3075541 RepID=A0ABU2LBD2_9ACTN|nr:DUF2470 domain-containing protein [Streptomyces sp. DSM 44917]MDT0308786.1 DUF2470 domain-containing protein [Streptomyces sp. DSM 44917]
MFRTGRSLPAADEDARQPSGAERVRTLVAGNASAVLVIPGCESSERAPATVDARAVSPSGDVLLLLPVGSPATRAATHATADEVTAVMEITDVAPVAVPHRIRGRGWVAGWLTHVPEAERPAALALLADERPGLPEPGPGAALLRLEVGEAYTDDLWGAEHVEPEDFAEAAPDPLARHEAELLQHLAASHGSQLRSLCALVGDRGACAGWQRVVPLGLDRFGLRVRFCAADACFDARFEFPHPVTGIPGLRTAIRHLFDAAGA